MANNMWPTNSKSVLAASIACIIAITAVGTYAINLAPMTAFGGAIWFKHGVHYSSDAQIAQRIEQLNAPAEAVMSTKISSSTQACDTFEEGFCQQSPAVYADKTVVTPAVAFIPGTPDRKEVNGYCTLCNDGTFSPSCAVGRGACSYHSGVNSYNVPEYRTIPGTPAVEAKPAVYSYSPKSYKESSLYVSPEAPSLEIIVGY